jgi:hypothetical protein
MTLKVITLNIREAMERATGIREAVDWLGNWGEN